MDDGETKRSTGYGKPPWMFKGSALYQLHLVRAETARACIPKEFRLVEAFGYTLGGFFLASYDDSPAGVFDELVVIAGLVWSPPTSCAWATKVLVNSDAACDHGRKEVGLPSQVARFSKRITAIPRKEKSEHIGFLDMIGMSDSFSDSKDHMDVQVTEVNGPAAEDDSSISLTTLVPALKYDKWMGPTIKLSLPSFSGRTEYTPEILKYSCKIQCRVRAVQPAKVSSSDPMPKNDKEHSELHSCCTRKFADSGRNLSTAIMLSKPILALKFSCMTMQVEAPSIVSDCSKKSLRTC
ncbi:protein NEOXANTHIN-DEFICIENT 1 [Ziziphus jujuba]|uniref:Protein NEOXANTHIN-DEFICIENT 1 n=5 Tax=Ziziphus jujuba TaxID=326968 RepID=A0A6P6GI85_ZIZJJ|nr:protein NEOXANTHIN-DEFICIENT 1 [Ziziphus jujuba]XP_015895937.3 protein NEOXANTHIN-DEFICIENT 1 [Ziziphus jujuba]XP_024933796.3 protein NEOXANTHIN-DEFICIENT 1 [Ziziphus jujuba]XP_024933797.3 protein NEOXANTHIN-DEFICIENT 1 [Ziziphus jujuba]XP_048318386.2 protein NEOXANTHIN-DEFICIENT 1 [Ziziphus jujuba]